MKHFAYFSEDTYTFENLDDLQMAIKFDEIGQVRINEQDQIIQYNINREEYIRLSDLVNFISINLVRIHLGQLLVLVQSLAQKVQKMKEANIEHFYLDCNRIWLNFTNLEQRPSVKYQYYEYKIHFTGYQCPNYEKNQDYRDLKIESSKRIMQIIKNIIIQCQDKIILKQNLNKEKLNIMDIIEPLLNRIEMKGLSCFIKEIDDCLKKYNYDSSKQIIDVDDDNLNISNRRFDSQVSFNKWIKRIFNQEQSKLYRPYILEFFVYQFMYQYVEWLKKFEIQENINSDQSSIVEEINFDQNSTAEKIQATQSQIQIGMDKFLRECVQQEIQKQIKIYQENYKFSINELEIENKLVSIISQNGIMKYFNNTYTYNFYNTSNQNLINQLETPNSNNLYEAMKKAIFQIIPSYVDQYIELEYIILILELIDDLI